MSPAAPVSTRLLEGLPLRALTAAAGVASRWNTPTMLRRPLFGAFARATGADLSEAADPPEHFATFEEFFLRELRDGARAWQTPEDAIAMPSDGRLDALGVVEEGRMIQAKGIDYAAQDLLAGEASADALEGARYATIYLAPADYHRVHVPTTARWVSATHVGGALRPVNGLSVPYVPALFCTNERVVCTFELPDGQRLWVVLVGATVVGRILIDHAEYVSLDARTLGQLRTALSGEVAPGDPLGGFGLGSTVIIVAERGAEWSEAASAGVTCRAGTPLFFRASRG